MTRPEFGNATEYEPIAPDNSPTQLVADIRRHMVSTLGADYKHVDPFRAYMGLAYAVRDRLIDDWIRTQRTYYDEQAKRVYYLSMEFLPGRFLAHNLHNLGLTEAASAAVGRLGLKLEDVTEVELDPGLGNGGLGRLASCYMDAMAALRLPGYGYGIRYDYGIFSQRIIDGQQVERPDHWMRHGNPWEFSRPVNLIEVNFGGRVVNRVEGGHVKFEWVDTENVMAMPCDIIVPGFRNGNSINMRLWAARSSREINLQQFNKGNYVGAIEDKIRSENISKVLYPSEAVRVGKELRLKQEYFFVAATIQDILRRFRKRKEDFKHLPDRVAIQLNDTHPAIAVAELMRVLVDVENVDWEKAWNICTRTFAYTNHTVLPEALETWSLELLASLLPRHVQIIHEVNRRFLLDVEKRHPGDWDRRARMAIVTEGGERIVRMAHLAVVGSHSVNGVSALHSKILETHLMKDFADLYPGKFNNKTNGVNHRRFLSMANPALSALITSRIGDGWLGSPEQLGKLRDAAGDDTFLEAWARVRQQNKDRFAHHLAHLHHQKIDPNSLFDIQVKRLHEYKRQLLNVLHAITLYRRIRDGNGADLAPRTILIGGKAAPSYVIAKLIIQLACGVADVIRADKKARGVLQLEYIPDYNVSMAERLLGATDLSEQISTAGMEASGTGNMKVALNGALIIGTMDGANVEIVEHMGRENMFVFGHSADEVRALRAAGYDPRSVMVADEELNGAMGMIADGTFSKGDVSVFQPLLSSLLDQGDHFQVLADYRAYVDCQADVEKAWRDQRGWMRRSVRSVASMGFFAADRAVREYAEGIWHVRSVTEHG